MKKTYAASYTVEASYVMAIVIFSLAILIKAAYTQCKEQTGVFKLHYVVEQLRGQEAQEELEFLVSQWKGYAVREEGKVEGTLEGSSWTKEIQVSVHNPEKLMRMSTIFQADGQGEESWTK